VRKARLYVSVHPMANSTHPLRSDYPKDTTGSRLAAKIRAKSNDLADSKRETLFKKGMSLIYGGGAKQAVSVRH